jgi:hypothetical protein
MRMWNVLGTTSLCALCIVAHSACSRPRRAISTPRLPANQNYIDLQLNSTLRVENAYYQPGASRRGVEGFLGTEIAKYRVTLQGLRELAVTTMAGRPENQLPVQRLISRRKLKYLKYRLYYEVVFTRSSQIHGSVLLGANSLSELNELSARLVVPESVCNKHSAHCTVFPEACSVSIE